MASSGLQTPWKKENKFGGVLPYSLGILSTQLRQLRLGGNNLYGQLTIANHNLTWSIPNVISNLRMLRRLDLSRNSLSSPIPSSIANTN
ncbi:hypothetical protein CUMW_221170 [Citrus unshiu]|uniref:Leucine-rich repeat-containing N-terminal plant-type domain-containing protein n=1 Tax=Citrus unshiu TaxID=55188 RepID=A0A2H5QF55_CITUN|nr:hypothetical protein CUMW_221170 [Citrus unshiu]